MTETEAILCGVLTVMAVLTWVNNRTIARQRNYIFSLMHAIDNVSQGKGRFVRRDGKPSYVPSNPQLTQE